jgi:hypothetical protein
VHKATTIVASNSRVDEAVVEISLALQACGAINKTRSRFLATDKQHFFAHDEKKVNDKEGQNGALRVYIYFCFHHMQQEPPPASKSSVGPAAEPKEEDKFEDALVMPQ